MKKTNLFIAGAARSGTTSLWNYFRGQPEIFVPDDELLKEPSYFADINTGLDLNGYKKIYENTNKSYRYTVDASVGYLTDPGSAKRIFNYNKNSKIIIILRNPADRAYSLYGWMVQEGYEYLTSFEKALQAEEERVFQKFPNWFEPNYYWGYLYFRSGLYYEQVKRYLDLFKDGVFLIKFEDLMCEPGRIYKDLCSFLGIEPRGAEFGKYNRSVSVKSAKLQFLLRKLNNYVINSNLNGIPIDDIQKKLRSNFSVIIQKFREQVKLNTFEFIQIQAAFFKVYIFLGSLSDKYFFKNQHKKSIRDKILDFGLKNKPAGKLNEKTRTELLLKYKKDIKILSSLTDMSFFSWLQK